ncbi:hypothetical protein BH11ACT4_BH11ACT4_11640 [soil metagenome]
MSDTQTATAVRVLVVEDSAEQAGLLRRHLERAGCTVTIAETGEDAMVAYHADSPDLAIIDLVLPGMAGRELVLRLRSELPECKIAITSVFDVAEYPASDGALPKPFTGAQVRAVLDHALPGRLVA